MHTRLSCRSIIVWMPLRGGVRWKVWGEAVTKRSDRHLLLQLSASRRKRGTDKSPPTHAMQYIHTQRVEIRKRWVSICQCRFGKRDPLEEDRRPNKKIRTPAWKKTSSNNTKISIQQSTHDQEVANSKGSSSFLILHLFVICDKVKVTDLWPGHNSSRILPGLSETSGGRRSPDGGGPPSWSTPVTDHKISRHGHGTSHAFTPGISL